jgi:hypothetical protein
MNEPTTKEEYEVLYHQNYKVTGFGAETTNHFPCPFCAAPGWSHITIVEMGNDTRPHECKNCGRSAKMVFQRDGSGTKMSIVQTAGADPPPWVPIKRGEDFENPIAEVRTPVKTPDAYTDPEPGKPIVNPYGNEPTKPPDIGGIALGGSGRAWKIATTDPEILEENVDWNAGVGSYLVHAPHGHPYWYWYCVGCVHLRDIPGQSRPPRRDFPEATHEMMFLALNPEAPIPDVDDWQGMRHLSPVDLEHQFQVNSDEEAAELTELVVRHICAGQSPDQDFRTYWRGMIDETAERIRLGKRSDREE